MVRPFESKVKQIEERIEGVDKDTVNIIVRVLKEFAIMDVKMGETKQMTLFGTDSEAGFKDYFQTTSCGLFCGK